MKWIEIVYILLFTAKVFTRRCSRYPSNTFTPKSPVDENFGISITGNVQTYILGKAYNVSLHAYNGHRFISAKLVLENENGEKGLGEDLGQLEVVEPAESRYSQQCVNMVESTNSNPKTRMTVVWKAPTVTGNGCILIRATLLQHRDVWFMDDGGLTKRICEEVSDDVESQKKDSKETPCCSCDEARYELIFQSLWSRNLHPKNFPNSAWVTRFSDIVGAAHTSDYRFWDKGVSVSAEMQEFAEHGSSLGLEREFNQYFRKGKIRTVIKARGPAFPFMNTPTIASVRVDPLRHQISIASKIMPSPDWIVGVPGVELCLDNCTWLEEKVINLYPWDIGTDAGPSYTSPDQPQFPADVVRRMSSEYPPDTRSPFFDETHAPMKPLATLTINRQRLYERKCEDEESNNPDTIPRECFSHPWTAWSDCSAQCGEGWQYRTRVYKQPDMAKIYNCDVIVQRRQDRACQGEKCSGMQANFGYENEMSDTELAKEIFEPSLAVTANKNKAECRLKHWSPWSQCSVTCGNGVMERTRQYFYPYNEKECQEAYYFPLKEYKKCQGNTCLGQIPNSSGDKQGKEKLNDNSDIQNYDTDFRTSHNSYESFKSSPEYVSHKHIRNENQNRLSPLNSLERLENNFNDLNSEQENEEEQENEYGLQAEDLIQETSEEEFKRQYSKQYASARPKETFNNIKPSYQIQEMPSAFKPPPEYCHQLLNITNACTDPRVVRNFWFYNYCTNECMLYAADKCDNNLNKFHSLEQCEEVCLTPMRSLRRFLKKKQTQGCWSGQGYGIHFKKRKDYHM